MSIGISLKLLGKGLEWYIGSVKAKWAVAELSLTAFTLSITASWKVGW